MKNLSRMLTILLVLAMSMSVASCGRKVIDGDDFTKIMEDKFDCEVTGFAVYDEMEENRVATSEALGYRIDYRIYEKEETAEDYFENVLESLEDGIEDEDDELEGTVKKTGSGNYTKIVFEGELEYDDKSRDTEYYIVMIRLDDMIILATAGDTGKSTTKEIGKVIKELGY